MGEGEIWGVCGLSWEGIDLCAAFAGLGDTGSAATHACTHKIQPDHTHMYLVTAPLADGRHDGRLLVGRLAVHGGVLHVRHGLMMESRVKEGSWWSVCGIVVCGGFEGLHAIHAVHSPILPQNAYAKHTLTHTPTPQSLFISSLTLTVVPLKPSSDA